MRRRVARNRAGSKKRFLLSEREEEGGVMEGVSATGSPTTVDVVGGFGPVCGVLGADVMAENVSKEG